MLNGMCYKLFHVMHLLPMKARMCECAFEAGRYQHKNWTDQLTSKYLSPQTAMHMQSAERQLTYLSLKIKKIITLCHFLSLSFIYSFFCSTFIKNPLLPKWIHPQRTHFLSSQLSVNISDTAPDISHTSQSIPLFLFFFWTFNLGHIFKK